MTLPLPARSCLAYSLLSAVVAASLVPSGSALCAQIIQEEATASPAAPRYGSGVVTRYKVGAEIKAKGGTVRDIRLMVAVPLDCPEQQAQVLEEDFSPHIEAVDFRTLPEQKNVPVGARQMLIISPELPPRQEAHAVITYEVVTKSVLPPQDPSLLKIPAKPERWLKPYLAGSPFINVDHPKIRAAVRDALSAKKAETKDSAPATGDRKSTDVAAADDNSASVDASADENAAESSAYEEVASPGEANEPTPPGTSSVQGQTPATPTESASDSADADSAGESTAEHPTPDTEAAVDDADVRNDWEKVEAIYDYVQEHVKYEEGAQDKPALHALQEGKGDCHGISALFVAMCRTAKTPARMVWVDGHQYAEFYLEEAPGKGYWFPVQSAGTRAFGEMPTPKVILQKGDNFRVPERRRERLRYASDYTLLLAEPRFKPTVTYIREQL